MRTLIAIALLIAVSLAQYGEPAPPAPAQYGGAPPAAPATCQLNPRSNDECARIAKDNKNCQDCVTSNCKGCQKVFIKYCTQPQRANSVEECLARANEADCPGHTVEDCHNHARQGLAAQCAEQACQGGAPQPAPGTCQLKPRSEAECAEIAKNNKNCQDCVTSNCKGCQKVFIKYCTQPQRANSVEECLARANEADCPGHTVEDCHNHARQGLAAQCAEQACQGGPAQPPAPRDDRPRECPAKKPKQDIDLGTLPLPKNHLRGGRRIADKLRSLSKSLDLLTYTLRLKGVTVDAPCAGKTHVVNLDKFEWPKPAPTTTAKPTPAPVQLPTGGALAWIHAETKADYPAGADAKTVRQAEYAAATKDIDAISTKLDRVEQARQNVKVEYEAAATFGNITPDQKKDFEARENHLEQLEGALKVLYAQAQKRKESNT